MSKEYVAGASTRGRVLDRVVTVIVNDGQNEVECEEKRVFITRAQVGNVSELRQSAVGTYRSIWIKSPDSIATYVHVYGDLLPVVERYVRENRFYGFEGTARYSRSNNGRLARYVTLTKLINVNVSVSDAPKAQAEDAEVEEVVMPL